MILQILPSISPHDAISQHVLRIDQQLKQQNIETGILAHHINPLFKDIVQPYNEITSLDDHHIVYHMSIASSLAEKIHSSNTQVDLWYHNITPASYFEPWEPFVSLELRIARQQLSQMALRANRGVAASHYSELELQAYGCRHTSVMPILFDPNTKVVSHSKSKKSKTHILAVGRFSPNKRIEKLIYSLSMYRDLVDKNTVLDLVGTCASKWYMESLEQLIESLDLKESVVFHHGISDDELAVLYASSDAYLCLSEHEGFCVPLLEAQYSGLPIVACDFSAIKETVNGAGIVLPSDYEIVDVVSALDIVINDDSVRDEIMQRASTNRKNLDIDKEAVRAVEWIMDGLS